jgi:outer membrane protein OmpA-like peptidoglycan-associated protein
MSRRILSGAVILLLLCSAIAMASDELGRNGIAMELGFMKLASTDQDFSNIGKNLGLYYSRDLNLRWSLVTGLTVGWTRPAVEGHGSSGWTMHRALPQGREIYTVLIQPRAEIQFNFRPESRWSPFAGFGVGLTSFKVKGLPEGVSSSGLMPDGSVLTGYDYYDNPQELKGTRFTAAVGTGFSYQISSAVSCQMAARFHIWPGNSLDMVGLSAVYDDPSYTEAAYGMPELSLGFTWHFGNADKDNDGIMNNVDGCPDKAEDFDGFEDFDGCPDLDNDRDGITDLNDTCPDQAEDFDSFEDTDGCPDLDNDGDGIPDLNDGCPNQAEDFDGFEDRDGCPDLDDDGDRVPDARDKCPNTPLGIEVDENGCPLVQEIKEDLILRGVKFGGGSAELTEGSQGVLELVAYSLLAWPNVVIEVHGHTDSKGAAAFNRELSQKRADSVRTFLLDLGIAPERVIAIGFGEGFPIATNGTPEGRATNRRVEIRRVK